MTRAGSRSIALAGFERIEIERAVRSREASREHSSKRTTVLLAILVVIGLVLLAYPSFSDYWNSFHQSRAIMNYSESVSKMNAEEFEAIIDSAKAYNEEISREGIQWIMEDDRRTEYMQQLDFNANGNMGYIDIPKIDVKLPIFHGTSEQVLQTSIGHLEQTSLPVGGEGTHCVLSGHRGLPSAKLFSDLNKLEEGDVFTLSVLNETLSYQVDQIRVVEPSDLTALELIPGKDLCTLVTCTPYGINTHRMLVRGHRVENPDGDAKVIADALQVDPPIVAPFLGVPAAFLLLMVLMIAPAGKRDHRVEEAEEQALIEDYGQLAELSARR